MNQQHLWIHLQNLMIKPGSAGSELSWGWTSIARGAAFDQVADIDVVFLIKTNLRQGCVQEASGTANKGTTLRILISPWRLSNHHQPR